jgi:hypothetical protein
MLLSFSCFAQETITLSTYYPSPFGLYQRLVTSTLGVGDVDGIDGITAADAPDPSIANQEGDLWVAGDIGIGTTNPSGPLEIDSTTGGFIPPRMTGTQRDNMATPVEGMVIYNDTADRLEVYTGGTPPWQPVGAGAAVQGSRNQVAQVGYCSDSWAAFGNQVRTTTINTSGGPVLVLGTYTGHSGANNWCAGAQLTRDGTQIYQTLDHHNTAAGFTGIQWDSPVIFAIDKPPAGSHTYALYSQAGSANVFSSALYAIELE